jgi:hypothetical protein
MAAFHDNLVNIRTKFQYNNYLIIFNIQNKYCYNLFYVKYGSQEASKLQPTLSLKIKKLERHCCLNQYLLL